MSTKPADPIAIATAAANSALLGSLASPPALSSPLDRRIQIDDAAVELTDSVGTLDPGGGGSGGGHDRRRGSGNNSVGSGAAVVGWRSLVRSNAVARRTLGLCLLSVTVCLWTTSNFLASYIFSDNTYSKPFFVVYVNSSVFAFSLVPMLIAYTVRHGFSGLRDAARESWTEYRRQGVFVRDREYGDSDLAAGRGLLADDSRDEDYRYADQVSSGCDDSGDDDDDTEETRRSLASTPGAGRTRNTAPPELLGSKSDMSNSIRNDDLLRSSSSSSSNNSSTAKLSFVGTAKISFEFSFLWAAANYFASACLEYTSVGSATILTSTSSVWTLVFCALWRVETFTLRKLAGVAASLLGVVLISTVDLSGSSDENRGNFPHKTTAQVAVGDAMAFVSAVVYGLYVTVMKRRVGDEDRVNMQLFFGLVGFFNLLMLWPGFIVLHFTGVERFGLPPSSDVWTIIIANSLSSFFSDMSWAYAMLLTTPVMVTVGLSLTIPLSLVGEMFQYSRYSSTEYWIGAAVVFFSFIFINRETQDTGGPDEGVEEGEGGR